MKVHKVIIHELYKPLGTTGAKLSKSKSLMNNTHEDVIRLIDELNRRYRRSNEKQGIFDKQNPTKFHETFEQFHTSSTDDKFIEFSHTSAENLRERIEGIGSAKGGYLVYSLYEDYRNYCSVFFVRDTTSIAFKRNKSVETFDLDKVQHIDFEKLSMACRINMDCFTEADKKYLSFIHHKRDDLSRYFINWISSTDTVSSEEDTRLLLRALKTIPITNEQISNELVLDRDELIRSTHRIITANPTRTVSLHDLSKSLFDNEDYLPNYVYLNEEYSSIPTEFKAHTSTLRRFVKVYAKADNIELNFYPSAYKDGMIKFDSNDASQIIIKSSELVKQVKESLTEE